MRGSVLHVSILVISCLLFSGCSQKAEIKGDAEDKSSLDQLLGTWTVTEAPRHFQPKQIVFDSDRFTFVFHGGEEKRDRFSIDAKAKPAQIDLGSKGKAAPGIYEINGDTLRIC